MTASKRKKPTRITRDRKQAASDALLRCVGRYVKAHGGGVTVAGPIQLMRWPYEEASRFTIGIACLGRAPEKPIT